jgi:hypothetical protein
MPRIAGALLLVVDRRGILPPAVVCRPPVSPPCLGWAGTATETSIAIYDVDAAVEYDRLALEARRAGGGP